MRLALGTVLLWFIGTGRATPTEAEIAPLGWASKIEVRQPIPNTAHAHKSIIWVARSTNLHHRRRAAPRSGFNPRPRQPMRTPRGPASLACKQPPVR